MVSRSDGLDDLTDDARPGVQCETITRRYTGSDGGWFGGQPHREAVTAVDDVSMSVAAGEVVGLSGPSGSGKTTLLHLLAALDRPTSGRVLVAGQDTAKLSTAERARFRLEHVGIVFQRFHLLPALTARGNVALPLIERGVQKQQRRARADELLERVGLADRATHRPRELSGGEQQRVAVARALATDPAIVIADEPTGELDATASEQVIGLLTGLASDRAVVIASHDEAVTAAVDRVIALRDGAVVDRG